MCIDMCTADMCIDMCVNMYTDMWIVDMCIDMCMDMCPDVCHMPWYPIGMFGRKERPRCHGTSLGRKEGKKGPKDVWSITNVLSRSADKIIIFNHTYR